MQDSEIKRVTILGSTGSIGRQTADVLMSLKGFRVTALAADSSVEIMEQQARALRPGLVAMRNQKAARDLSVRLRDTATRVASGDRGVMEAAVADTDILVAAIVGNAGLVPTLAAVRQGGRRIALANKETLVCAGHLFTEETERNGCELIPVDSEHSAIFQSLRGGRKDEIKKIILTGSGGPFRNVPKEDLFRVTPQDALKHPTWSMGAKITVDSATMMNKGLEVIEAMHLFGVSPDMIEVVVHPQSVLHSAVEFRDNAVIAQLGYPDMRLPIQLALTYPERLPSPAPEADLTEIGALTFEKPDLEKFGCLRLALSVAGRRDAAPVVMNAANEEAVRMFLDGTIGFMDIYEKTASAVEELGGRPAESIEEVLERDREAREYVLR